MQAARSTFPFSCALVLVCGFIGTWACSSDPGSPSSGAGSSAMLGEPAMQGSDFGGVGGAAGAGGAPVGSDEAGTSSGGSAQALIPDFNGCTTAAYEDRSAADASRTIGIATMGLTFTPKCMQITAGQTVRWEGALSAHPLAPGNPDHPDAGSAGSPILMTSSGDSVEFTFDKPGTFPYYCQVHAFGDGKGMAGVVYVAP